MNAHRLCLIVGLLLFAAGCASTPDSRIAANPSAFAAYPPEVQANIRAGIVGVGYTQEQVLLARGQPDGRDLRQTATGQAEDWFYGDHRARLSLGIGGGTAGPNSAVGGSASVGGIPLGHPHMLRVSFENGVVTAVEGPPQTPR